MSKQYITQALTELAATSSSGATIPSVRPLDDLPDPRANGKKKVQVVQPVAVIEQEEKPAKPKKATRTKVAPARQEIPSVKEAAARPSPSKGSFAYPIVSVIEEDEDPHLWRTPQEEADYRFALSLSRPVRDRITTNRYQPDTPAARYVTTEPSSSAASLPPALVMPETAFRLDSIQPRGDWRLESHLYANTSGVNRHAGMGLFLGANIDDASQLNAVPITTYVGQIVDDEESRSDRHDFTYAHAIPDGRVVLGDPTSSWGPWMNHTWNRRKVNCVIRWNEQLQCLVLYAIAPIREGDELLTYYGRGYWLAILHTLDPELQQEAILEGQFSEVEIFTGLEADRDVRGPAVGGRSPRLRPILDRLRGGVPPFKDYWTERARSLPPHLARTLLHDARTVLEMNGMTGSRYTELDDFLDELLGLERLQVTELDPTTVQNGSRSWSLPPRLVQLGLQWIRDEDAGVPFDNTTLDADDFTELLGTYHMEDFRGLRSPIKYLCKSFRTNKKVGPTVKRAVASAGRAGRCATAASPPTIHRILMATVRYLQDCGAARTPGWTDLLAHPPADSPNLSQTVLVNSDDADTAPMRSGDVDVEELRIGAPPRRRRGQAVEEALEASSRTSESLEDDSAVEATTGKKHRGSSDGSKSSADQLGVLDPVHAMDQGE